MQPLPCCRCSHAALWHPGPCLAAVADAVLIKAQINASGAHYGFAPAAGTPAAGAGSQRQQAWQHHLRWLPRHISCVRSPGDLAPTQPSHFTSATRLGTLQAGTACRYAHNKWVPPVRSCQDCNVRSLNATLYTELVDKIFGRLRHRAERLRIGFCRHPLDDLQRRQVTQHVIVSIPGINRLELTVGGSRPGYRSSPPCVTSPGFPAARVTPWARKGPLSAQSPTHN